MNSRKRKLLQSESDSDSGSGSEEFDENEWLELFDENELAIMESINGNSDNVVDEFCSDQIIKEVTGKHGVSAEEFITIGKISAASAEATEAKKATFEGSLSGSTASKLATIVETLDDNEATSDVQSIKSEYIRSLSSLTIYKAGRAMALYLMFLSTYCIEKGLKGYALEDFRVLASEDRIDKFKEMMSYFINFLRYHYQIDRSVAKRKNSENLEPNSIMCYGFSLVVAFKIINVMPCEISRSNLMKGDSMAQMRATFKQIKSTSPMFKEAFTPTDAIEFVKRVPIKSVMDLQMFTCETGLRVGTIIASNFKVCGTKGILLKDISFRFRGHGKFSMIVKVPHEKQNLTENQSKRELELFSDASYCQFNAAVMCFIMVTTFGYTTQNLVECLESEQVVFKEGVADYPLFARVDPNSGSVQPGALMLLDDKLWDWVSKSLKFPRTLLSNRSARKGYAKAYEIQTYANDTEATQTKVGENLASGGNWDSESQAISYLGQPFGALLANYQVYNQSTKAEIAKLSLESNLTSVLFSDKFLSDETHKRRLEMVEIKRKERYDMAIETLKNGPAYKTMMAIKQKPEYANLLKKNGDWKTGAKEKLSEDDRKVYESNYKEYRNGASKANERITSKFALFTDALNRKNWLEFRKSITLDEFYKPEEHDFLPRLDFSSIYRQLKYVKLPSAMASLSVAAYHFDSPDGVNCPFFPRCDSTDLFKTYEELREHGVKVHSFGTNITHDDKITYKCLDDGCQSEKCTSRSFVSHNQKVHGWIAYCQNCEEEIPQHQVSSHQKANKDHVVLKPWEFNQIAWDVVDERCECIKNSSIKIWPKLRCVTEAKEIQQGCTECDVFNASFKTYQDYVPNGTKREYAEKYASTILKLDVSDLPQCVKDMISQLPAD